MIKEDLLKISYEINNLKVITTMAETTGFCDTKLAYSVLCNHVCNNLENIETKLTQVIEIVSKGEY